MRPKWTELYAARRQQCGAASHLPELPDSFFGWIPVLHKITEEEVLHSAGMDAFVVSAWSPGAPTGPRCLTESRHLVPVLLQIRDSIFVRSLHHRAGDNSSHPL